MRSKTKDPVLIKMRDQQEKLYVDFEKAYLRMKRAFNRLDKIKKKIVRLARRIEKHVTARPTA